MIDWAAAMVSLWLTGLQQW